MNIEVLSIDTDEACVTVRLGEHTYMVDMVTDTLRRTDSATWGEPATTTERMILAAASAAFDMPNLDRSTPAALRWIRPVVESDGPVELGHVADMDGLRVVVADWAQSLTEDEREDFPSPQLWWAEE